VEGYPFPFEKELIFHLTDDEFITTVTVKNSGSGPMPMGYGWHPYYRTGTAIDHLSLKYPPCERYEIDRQMIPTGKMLEFTDFSSAALLGRKTFDDGFRIKTEKPREEVMILDEKKDVRIHIWQETGPGLFNYIQMYTPDNRQSICIEPMSCAADAFNNGDGLTVLQAGQQFRGKFGVYLN
jgi:aldose 1-epimerase